MTTEGGEEYSFLLLEENLRDLATDSIYLWLITSEGWLKKFTMDGIQVDSITSLFSSGWGLTWENDHLWVSDPASDSIYRVKIYQFQDISADSVKNWMDSEANLVILDVRELYEFESYGRIPGALNMPWNSGVLDTAYSQFSTADTIIIVCQSGYRSEQASIFLDLKGFINVYNILGGMNVWHHPVEVGGHVTVNADWNVDKSPFIAVADIIVDSTETLTLLPGVNLEFDGYFSLEAFGNIVAQGTVENNIHFTSRGSLPSGWKGITVNEGSNSSFDHCRIDSSENGIVCFNAAPPIENSWISVNQTCLSFNGPQANPSVYSCELDGFGSDFSILILCDSSSAPYITYSSIRYGEIGVLSRNNASPQLNYNNIYNNIDYGVLNEDSSLIIDAQLNWWGDESGPFDPLDNPDGQGDWVSQWVDYEPWLHIQVPYICGDANADSTVSVVDVVHLVNYLFKSGSPPDPWDAGNVNCDEEITIADAVFLINYIFKFNTAPCDCTEEQLYITRPRRI